ncbi:guanylate kinase [soil metagenome]
MYIEGRGNVPGQLVVLSGPSGSGKSTLIRRLLDRPDVQLQLSLSATTRNPRPGEQDGLDYHFMDADAFRDARDRGEFLETAIYNGNFYGTPVAPVYDALQAGTNVLMEIEVQGALQIRERAPSALFLFIKAPTFAELERRLLGRGDESDPSIRRRLVHARHELAEAHWYDYRIINDNRDRAVDELASILKSYGCGGEIDNA